MNWYSFPPWWWGWAAPLAEDRRNYNHTCVELSSIIYHEKRLTNTNTHSKQQRSRHYTTPCIECPEISSSITSSTQSHSRKVYVIFNGTNHHNGFDFRNKRTRRYACLIPKVVGHGICSTHFLAWHQFVSFQIPDRNKDGLNQSEHRLFRRLFR